MALRTTDGKGKMTGNLETTDLKECRQWQQIFGNTNTVLSSCDIVFEE